MHRRAPARHAPADAPRLCSGGDASLYALAPMVGSFALPVRVERVARPDVASPVAPAPGGDTVRLDRPPDSPPPRA
jgi:hypothetical protein